MSTRTLRNHNEHQRELISTLETYTGIHSRFGFWPHEITRIHLVPVDSLVREIGGVWHQAIIYSSNVTTASGDTHRLERVNIKHLIEHGADQDLRCK